MSTTGVEDFSAAVNATGTAVGKPRVTKFMSRVVPWPAPREAGYVNLHWTRPGKPGMGGRPYTKIEDLIGMAQWGTAHPQNVKDIYFCLSQQAMTGKVFNGHPTTARSQKTAKALKAIWFDIDVKKDKGYPTTAAALDALREFISATGLPPPTAVVASGSGGLHVYWISDRPLTVEEWYPYALGLDSLARKHGLKSDPGITTDSARVLRVPGTYNYKNTPPTTCSLLALAPTDIDFEKVLSKFRVYEKAVPATVTVKPAAIQLFDPAHFPKRPIPPGAIIDYSLETGADRESPPLDWKPIVAGCPHFAETWKNHGKDAPQGLWMLDVLAATFMDDPLAVAHVLSNGYATYTKDETNAMFDRKMAERQSQGLGWPSCTAFENAGCGSCAQCPHKGKIKSPLNLALRPAVESGNDAQTASPQDLTWNAAELRPSFANLPHRRWLYGTYLIRGEVTVLAAPGGAGKTALATGAAVEIATGAELLGERLYKAHDLAVLYINGEDSGVEITRRILAFRLGHVHKIGGHSLDRLYIAGADDPRVHRLSFLLTTDRNFTMLNQSGFAVLESALESLRPDLVILDPLVAFCGGGNMNDNAVMAQLVRALKSLATKFDSAVLIVHHTRKGADDGNPEAISGASATVNLARRALMPVPMTKEEAEQFYVLPSERYRYFKLVDAKSNLAPRSADSPWYRLHSIDLRNAEPPVYPHGDSVQAVVREDPSALQAAPPTTEDQKIRNAIVDLIKRGKLIDGQAFPYSPSAAGASKERAILNDAMAAVRDATAPRRWLPDDLKVTTRTAIKQMKAEGLLIEKNMKELASDPGRFRRGRGLAVVSGPTAEANANEGSPPQRNSAIVCGQLTNSRSID